MLEQLDETFHADVERTILDGALVQRLRIMPEKEGNVCSNISAGSKTTGWHGDGFGLKASEVTNRELGIL